MKDENERHPNLVCLTTWCAYWKKGFDGPMEEKVGLCGSHSLYIATVSGEEAAKCMSYKLHSDPARQGIHGPKAQSSTGTANVEEK